MLRYELELKKRSLVGWTIIVSLYIGLVAWAWSKGVSELREYYEQILREFPEDFIKLFGKGVPQVLTPEAFYSLEYFVLMYVIALGAFAAYLGAGIIVDDVLEKSGALHLSLPISRKRLLLTRFFALLILLSLMTVVSFALSFLLYRLFGVHEDMNYSNIALLHLCGTIYLTACAGLGVLAGSLLPFHLAKPTAAGIVVVGYVLDVMTLNTSIESIGYLSLSRYYEVLDIAIRGVFNMNNITVLIIVTLVFLVTAITLYERRDLPV
ncbi:MAG: ABC transporter permease subunit [Acidilobaceae archaeon]